MRHTALFTLVLVGGLAACGGNDGEVRDTDGDGKISAEEVEAQLGDAMTEGSFMSAGEWQSRITIEDVKMPGMTDDMAAMMQDMMGNRTFSTCLTPEDVEQPDERFFAGEDNDCAYDRFSLKGGKIDAQMTCNMDGVTQVMEMTGQYGEDAYDLTMRATSEDQGGMTMTMNVSAERVGDCTGEAA
ncbi:DUF3617 domain-containing protein [Sphingomicrobium arenosum]|uniref:DUF3617 domain-containing protein n=1 Tax=Sphingomicrobium arenosum TaxID=2233861 RepID=UPI002240F4ED|nr:DUF3617 domain-containing protein [Sphingomicrobium arenosum]